jgi:hypothetical protein
MTPERYLESEQDLQTRELADRFCITLPDAYKVLRGELSMWEPGDSVEDLPDFTEEEQEIIDGLEHPEGEEGDQTYTLPDGSGDASACSIAADDD